MHGLKQRVLVVITSLVLLLQPFFQVGSAFKQRSVIAQETLKSEISFDKDSFNISVNTNQKVNYILAYKTDSQIEAVKGESDVSENNFSRKIQAATCSSGGTCIQHNIIRGILKTEVSTLVWSSLKKFKFENGILITSADETSTTIDLTDKETDWLNNGGDFVPQGDILDGLSVSNSWDKNVDGSFTSKNNVSINTEYIAPFNNTLIIKFTKLPENPSKVTIKEIPASFDLGKDEQVGSVYEITSEMQDGEFAYDLTLPVPQNAQNDNLIVRYAESVDELKNSDFVSQETIVNEESLTVKSLDHLTVFVIAGTIINPALDTYFGQTFDETSSSAVINEFVYSPSLGSSEWVEIFNKTGTDIDLNNWTIEDDDGQSRSLTGTLPANGIFVYENTGEDFLDETTANGEGDVIYLKDNDTTVDKVTYQQQADGTVISDTSEMTIVDAGQSVSRIDDGGTTWQAGSPTKGWFNNAEVFDCATPLSRAPTLTSIANCLENQELSTNIGTIDNPSATPDTEEGGALYFENFEGRIVFEKTLNLSDQNTVGILQDLGMAMEMTNGHIKFDSDTAAAMTATGAKIYMYELGFVETPDIIIKNDAGEILGTNDPSAIDDIIYYPEFGELSFTALHFTQFDLPSAPNAPVLHEVSSPTNDTTPTLSWDDVSATPEVTSYDVEVYDSGGSNIYDGFRTTTSSSFTPEDPLPDDDYTWDVIANNAIGSSDLSDEGSFTIDTVAPGVTELGDGSTDVALEAGETYLTFDEVLSEGSKTAVENALTAGADKRLTYLWSDNTLVITASEITIFINDVVVNVFDLAGNPATSLLIVDSSLTTTQTSPNGEGNVTANSETPEVVITDPDQEVTVTVDGETEATIDVGSFITDGTGTIPKITINSDSADVAIPATEVTGPADWDGIITAPTITTIDLPVVSGETSSLGTAIEIGFSTDKLSFTDGVRILLPGQAGKRAGYSRPGTAFTEITTLCSADSQDVGDALGVDGDCKIDAGLDLVIWTKHFTKFASYTQTTNTTASSTTSSSSTGTSTGGNGTPTCSDTKPGSAPSGLAATGGLNSVTLSWNKASDPVSYYLVTYGLSSGSQAFGNPNVGNSSTTSYTVSNLSGGITYYFKVRAGNGCAPGEFSSEVSVTPSGGFVEGPATGFAPGVLGVATEEAKVKEEKNKQTLGQFTQTIKQNAFIKYLPFIAILLIIIFIFLKRKNMVK